MNVSIVIPNFNGENLLKNNIPKVIEAAKEYTKGVVEIIIVDDGSKDNSISIINHIIKNEKRIHIHLIANTSNKGFSSTVNRGVKMASGDIIVLLNTDVVPHKNFLTPLVKNFENKNVFAVGCLDESIENGKIILRGSGIAYWEKGFLVHKEGSLKSKETFWASGGSSGFKKSVWNSLGGFIELYNPFYWEDIDISYRARKNGFTILFEPKSIVTHEHTKGAIITHNTPEKIKRIAYRNQFFFVWLNITDIPLLASHIYWFPYQLITAILRKDFSFITGFFDACKHIFPVFFLRQKIHRTYMIKDQEILQKFFA
jgi:GT2 family glycosyltransferase